MKQVRSFCDDVLYLLLGSGLVEWGVTVLSRFFFFVFELGWYLHYEKDYSCIVRLKRDGTRAETRFRLSPKRTSPFKSAGASVQSTAGSRGVRISGCNAGYTTFGDNVRVLATHSIRQFPLHFPSRASPCAITFQKHSTRCRILYSSQLPRTQSLCCCHTTNSINRLVVQWRILNEITYWEASQLIAFLEMVLGRSC